MNILEIYPEDNTIKQISFGSHIDLAVKQYMYVFCYPVLSKLLLSIKYTYISSASNRVNYLYSARF